MRVAEVAGVALVLVSLVGCVGSQKRFRPYKGEPRPPEVEGPDPIEAQVQLKHEIPHDVLEDSTYIDQSRKETRQVLQRVHYTEEGVALSNTWLSYEYDMDRALGKDVLKHHAPKPKTKPDRPDKKKEGDEAGEGADKSEKPAADKPEKAEGGEKAEKPAEKGE